ncbi:MAG: type II/IV secretion system ATPase subunit [Bacilli bacterium]|nr:type II/IV secretion system ATPase subunit [Bacilli bacterium]
MNDAIFSQLDFGPLEEFLQDDNVTDISYSNGGQVWLKTLDKGVYQVNRPQINNPLMEKLAFQCANVMGKTFNMAHPMLDAESAELRMNFIHDSISTNGISCLIRKTPAKIRLNKEKLIDEKYITESLHDFLIQCIEGHANIIVSGETGSGKTELVKYLASHIKENEKIITIEDTLELHLDRIFPHRDIVALKTNNIASYSDVLVACMRQNPIWILLSEVRSAEAVMAVRNSISSGHHILSTIHSDKASLIPMRMFALIESNIDVEQFLTTIHRYVQIGIYVKGYMSKELGRFQREIMEICEFYVDENNKAQVNTIFRKNLTGQMTMNQPTKYLRDYLSIGGVTLPEDIFNPGNVGQNVSANSSLEVQTQSMESEIPLSHGNTTPVIETL